MTSFPTQTHAQTLVTRAYQVSKASWGVMSEKSGSSSLPLQTNVAEVNPAGPKANQISDLTWSREAINAKRPQRGSKLHYTRHRAFTRHLLVTR